MLTLFTWLYTVDVLGLSCYIHLTLPILSLTTFLFIILLNFNQIERKKKKEKEKIDCSLDVTIPAWGN